MQIATPEEYGILEYGKMRKSQGDDKIAFWFSIHIFLNLAWFYW